MPAASLLPPLRASRAHPARRCPLTCSRSSGPTGVGKTDVAIALADRLRARGERPVAVSADALQVYEGLAVLTARRTPRSRCALEHRLLGFVPVDARFSVGEYSGSGARGDRRAACPGRAPIVVGGTGLYLRAALAELDLKPAPPAEVRERWQQGARRARPEALHARLRERAAWAAETIDPRDRSRIVARTSCSTSASSSRRRATTACGPTTRAIRPA
jgi:tRNA dimethylallyltransferase